MKDLGIESNFEFDSAKDRDPLRTDPNLYDDEGMITPSNPHAPLTKVAALIAFVNENLYDVFQLAEDSNHLLLLDPSLEMLDKMRNLILMLMVHDHSRNTDYAKGLSQTWHQVIEYFTPSNLGRIESIEIRQLIKNFITSFKTFPKKTDHPLGHYLQKYAGENWLPFPFIAILKNLHEDHALHGENSQLNTWFVQISDLIDYFSSVQSLKKK